MLVKTNELKGAALDWAVAKANDWLWEPNTFNDGDIWWKGVTKVENYRPSTDWAQGGPIIEREKIELTDNGPDDESDSSWYASKYKAGDGFGKTALISAMRCYVASKLGAAVDVPEELL